MAPATSLLPLVAAVLSLARPLAAVERPNIIVILADDLGWAELGCYGQGKIRTPNLDRLAAEGQRWTQFYSGAPVCSPSRNVLLTGRHTGGCNVQDLKRVKPGEGPAEFGGDWPMDAQQYTLHQALQKVGYSTAAFGKWGMGEYGTTGAPDRKGVDYFYGYTDHRICHSFYPSFLWRNGVQHTINSPGIPGHRQQPEGEINDADYAGQTHASIAIRDEMLRWLEAHVSTARDRPFFLYYCPLEPHVAMQPPREWVERYPREWDSTRYRGEKGYLPHSRPRAAYAATISFLDDHVGRLLARLDELGLEENTLILFTSDNGATHDVGGVDTVFFASVAGLRGRKGQTYEGGLRVPMIARWPGRVPAGRTVVQPGYSADLMPTLCALTGADPGRPYGENLLTVLLGEKETLPARRPLVWTGGGYEGQVAVRLGDMKALRRKLFARAPAAPLDWEVYDLARDPGETTDLATTHREVIDGALDVLRREYQRAEGYREMAIFEPEAAARPAAPTPDPGEPVFRRLDTNGDARLTFEEWKLSPRAKANPARLEAIFRELDTDANGQLSPVEFGAQWKNH